MQESSDFDVVIAGGGMIGSSLALAMAPLGLRVAMVEPVAAGDPAQPSFDDRSTALSRSTQRMLQALDIWPEVREAATPIRHIHVSDKGRFGFAHIDAEEQQVEALGWVIINRVFGEVLSRHLDSLQRFERITPARITATNPDGQYRTALVEGDNGQQELRCRLLVAADGARSSVREMLGIGVANKRYGQTAIIGNL